MTEKKLKYIKGVGWRYETEHNQKRRYIGHRYNDVGTYLVTIVVEGRKPVFGSVAGNIKAHPTAPNYPATVLSPLGERVLNEELPKIPSIYFSFFSVISYGYRLGFIQLSRHSSAKIQFFHVKHAMTNHENDNEQPFSSPSSPTEANKTFPSPF